VTIVLPWAVPVTRGGILACDQFEARIVLNQLRGFMEHEIINDRGPEEDLQNPHLVSPQFNAKMISAAHPVEPLPAKQTSAKLYPAVRRFGRARWGLLAAILIAAWGTAALGGILLGLHEVVREQQGAAESPAPEPTVVKKAVKEEPRISTDKPKLSTDPVEVSVSTPEANVRTIPRISRRQVSIESARAADTKLEKALPRKVGEIAFGRGKGHQWEEVRPRRVRDKDDDH
jgi:hypothetical protein